MEESNIKCTIDHHIATITIQREKQLNALNKVTLDELATVFEKLRVDKDVRAILLTGAGEKAFVAGADIKEFASFNTDEGEKLAKEGQSRVFDRIANFPKPILAAINGFALGGGLELALAAHLRIASSNAKMGLPEVSLGLIPGYGGTQRLTQLVGKGRAIEMICTGEMISAETALQIGLVNHIYTPSELLPNGLKILQKITQQAPLAVSAALEAVNHSHKEEGFSIEIQNFGKLFGTQDFKEGTQAFIEKRKANFEGS